jgi:hypothetical protein
MGGLLHFIMQLFLAHTSAAPGTIPEGDTGTSSEAGFKGALATLFLLISTQSATWTAH